jgi:hypothetical protein
MTNAERLSALLLKALDCQPTTEQVKILLAVAARIASNKFEWDLRDVSEGGDIEVDK